MKRVIAVTVLLMAGWVAFKLAARPSAGVRPTVAPTAAVGLTEATLATGTSEDDALRARYPAERELVDRLLATYHHNALAIAKTDGLRGLVLLDRLGLEAVFLYEKHRGEFEQLRDALDDAAAADLLLHWREYFALKRADDIDRAILISQVAGLRPAQRQAISAHPDALPLLLAEPRGVTRLIERLGSRPEDLRDALVLLQFVSLEQGPADLKRALAVLEAYDARALAAFRLQGLDGFALVALHGQVLEALGTALPLDEALIVLGANAEELEGLVGRLGPEAVAGHVRHLVQGGLTEAAGSSAFAVRLVVEHGEPGEQALRAAGADAADVVYEEFAQDPGLQRAAVAALAEHGPMALAMLAKYGSDADFREVLRRHGSRAIPPIAQADAAPTALAALRAKDDRTWKEALAQSVLAVAPESGQQVIRQIQTEGIERVESLRGGTVSYYQFLPLYDLIHLGRVMGRGHSPTRGELTWAFVDGCFVVADALSLVALQPGAAVAAETARGEIKAAGREAVQAAGRNVVEEATQNLASKSTSRVAATGATAHLARWWSVRRAGGAFQVLRRLPEALPRLGLDELTRLGRPLCARAGMRLSTWAPIRLVRDGAAVMLRVPPERGLKYLAAQGVQAGVGVVAMHKMEEHLAAERPR